MLLGSPDLSVKISRAECIRNYPGLSSVTGREFTRALKKQLAEAEISVTDERVSGVYAMAGKFAVLTQMRGFFRIQDRNLARREWSL